MVGFGGFWRTSSFSDPFDEPVSTSLSQDTLSVARLRELEHEVARLMLLNQALWELLRERLNLTDDDLATMVHEVDLRDGVEDGRMTDTALKCPSCGRVSSRKHWKCLYCGQEFQKPVMG